MSISSAEQRDRNRLKYEDNAPNASAEESDQSRRLIFSPSIQYFDATKLLSKPVIDFI
jgi:hypothetical protein